MMPPMTPPSPHAFEREHGFTEAEWLRCLPHAVGPHALERLEPGAANVRLLGGGLLTLRWKVLPDRRIALLRMPRLGVRYVFDAEVSDVQRDDFLRQFDRYLQRGGG
jgi:hypothetical protein